MPVTLPIIHFNDVYRVRQKDKKSGGTIGADQFAAKIQSIRESWGEPSDLSNLAPPPPTLSPASGSRDWTQHSTSRERKGLVLFSGDLYSPSVESSVTRGTHLIPVINAMNLDCACLGNHDWDFGYPHLQTLMAQNNFPWLFSNVVDRSGKTDEQNRDCSSWDEDFQDDDAQVQGTLRYWTTVVQGVKVGCIGIVEKEWIATVPSFPQGFVYRNMVKTAQKLSRTLRDPTGEACELIIAITHSRLPNDIDFANAVGAVSNPDANSHGVDLVLGGHDHIYYVGNGASSFQGDEFARGEPGTENDKATMVVKSGTDFRDLSELRLELTDRNDSAVRKRTIRSLSVQRYRTSTSDATSPQLKAMLDDLLAKISKSTSQSVAYTLTPWDVRSEKVRTDESAFGNFVADVLMNSYEEVLRERDNRGELSEKRPASTREVDCALICGGSLRGDQIYGPGKIALSDVLEILPFEDAVVCKELKGQDIWDALENGLSMYPKQEGRFPQVAGMMVKWDSSKPPGNRLVSVELLDNPLDTPPSQQGDRDDMQNHKLSQDDAESNVGKLRRFSVTKLPSGGYDVEVHRPALVSRGPLEMEKTYRVVTREYLAEGYDGFEALKRGSFVVDHENGQLMSAIVRKFLLGASYLWRMKQMRRAQAENAASVSSHGDASGAGQDPQASSDQDRVRQEDDKMDTLSKRTRIAISRARSLNLLQRSIHPNSDSSHAACTPVKQSASAMASSDTLDKGWRMVVDQSPGGFRDALHVGGSEHHSQFDRVHRRFNEALPAYTGSAATCSDDAVSSVDAHGTETGKRDAKRMRMQSADDATIENALFDATLTSSLAGQIKDLLRLVMRAAQVDGKLYDASSSPSAAAAVQDDDDVLGSANIALGSIVDDEADADATLALLASGSLDRAARGAPTQLSKEIVEKATELRSTFARLESAARALPAGMHMNLTQQQHLVDLLQRFTARQNANSIHLNHASNTRFHDTHIESHNFHHGPVASTSFHLDQHQMDQLQSDIRSSATTNRAQNTHRNNRIDTDEETSNLAFVSPLVDGRLVDIARPST